MKLASYKGLRSNNLNITDRLIRFRLGGIYSHSEIIFTPEDGVDKFLPDKSSQPDDDGGYWSASSASFDRMPSNSVRRTGKMGGVRFKRIQYNPDKWDIIDYAKDPERAVRTFIQCEGMHYDWRLIYGIAAWPVSLVLRQGTHSFICSEICALAGGFKEPHLYNPRILHSAVTNLS